MSIRNPQASSAARLVSDFLKQNDVTLPHTKCLELVALAQGFKNAQHASAVIPVNAAKKFKSTEKPFTLYVHFGEEGASAWEDEMNPQRKANLLKEATTKSFATQDELDAYAQGLDDGNGWMDYALTTQDEATRIFEGPLGGVAYTVRVLVQHSLALKDGAYLEALTDLGVVEANHQERSAAFGKLYCLSFPNELDGDECFLKSTKLLGKEQVTPDIEIFHFNPRLQVVTFDTWHELEIVIKDDAYSLQEYLDELVTANCTANPDLSSKILGANWLRYGRHTAEVALKLAN